MDMLEGTEDTYEKRWKKLREFVDLAKAAQQSVQSDGQYLCARCGHPESEHPNRKCDAFDPPRK